VVTVEKTACTISDDRATSRSEHIDSKRRRKVATLSVIGLHLILSSSDAVAMIAD